MRLISPRASVSFRCKLRRWRKTQSVCASTPLTPRQANFGLLILHVRMHEPVLLLSLAGVCGHMQATLRPFNPITGRADVQLDECTSAPMPIPDYGITLSENWCRKVRAEETPPLWTRLFPASCPPSPIVRREALSGIYLSCFQPAHRL